MTLSLVPLTGKLAEPTAFILKEDNDRDRSCIHSGYIHVIHYTLTEECEKTWGGNGRGSRQTVTDALPASEMKSFALMLILMKRISEVLKFRFKRNPCESPATGGNQSAEEPVLPQTLPSHPPICEKVLKYIIENRITIIRRKMNLSTYHGHEISYAA